MRDLQKIDWTKFRAVPFSGDVLAEELRGYSAKNAKISALVADGVLVRLKRGLFCLSEEACGVKPEPLLAANAIYGPSYVSFETALALYGLVPERVAETMSVCAKRGRRVRTPIGVFSYRAAAPDWFPIGVRHERLPAGSFPVATPEKALGDLLLSRANLRVSSPRSLRTFLEEDVRFDFDAFGKPDPEILRDMAATGHKPLLTNALKRMFE